MGSRAVFLKFCLIPTLILVAVGCSLLAVRPVQEMSDTTAAIKAAREVQADTLAPELFRKANETFIQAKREYKYKNFALALEYAEKARAYAEEAEFEALRGGASREAINETPEVSSPSPSPTPYPYEQPQGVPFENLEKEKGKEPAPSPSP
jgi:hypothetical protein